MKNFKTMLIITISFIILSPQLFAHPPGKIELTFNNETKILQVEIQHEVRDSEKHYVNKIEVFLNDELRIIQNFKKQVSKVAQKATFLMSEAEVENKIKVVAYCNIHGKRNKEIIVKPKKPADQ